MTTVDAMFAMREKLRAEVAARVPAAKVYVGLREERNPDGTVKPIVFPHVWLHLVNEGPGLPILERPEANLILDLYARDFRELGELEKAVSWIDRSQLPTYGAAVNPRYSVVSKEYLEEASNRLRWSYILGAEYGNATRLAP